MITFKEAQELCSKPEWELVSSSFPPMIGRLSASDLKSRMERVGKLRQKSTELINRQHSDSRKQTTRRKTDLFGEVAGRFEAALNCEVRHAFDPGTLSIKEEEIPDETRALRMNTLMERADRELESRKSHSLSAQAVRGEQQMRQSGANRIQSHVGSVTRRKQGRRDTKNR